MSGCHYPYVPISDKALREEFESFKLLYNSNIQFDSKAWNELNIRINRLEEIINRITNDDMKAGKIPYKCPVCDGEGKNKNRIVIDKVIEPSTINMKNPTCIACEGKGIVWG